MFLPDSDGTSQTSPSGTHSIHGIKIPAASISENRLKDIIVNCPTMGKNPSVAQDGCPSIPSLWGWCCVVGWSGILGKFLGAPHCLWRKTAPVLPGKLPFYSPVCIFFLLSHHIPQNAFCHVNSLDEPSQASGCGCERKHRGSIVSNSLLGRVKVRQMAFIHSISRLVSARRCARCWGYSCAQTKPAPHGPLVLKGIEKISTERKPF